ncbi:MAG: hypothetical protein ACE5Q6_15030 [Dehalococcoidia bacterium]
MSTKIIEEHKSSETGIAQAKDESGAVALVDSPETKVHKLNQAAVDRMLEEALGSEEKTHGWAKVTRGLIAFYDWLSGPGMTDQERIRRELAETVTIRNYRGEI